MAEQPGSNYTKTLIAQASTGVRADGPVDLWADKTTHRLLVDAGTITTSSASVGATGSAVPSSADYEGINVGGTLRGATGVNPSGSVYAQQMDLASVGGTTIALGQSTMANSIPIVVASNQTSLPVTIGNSTLAVTQSGGWTVATNADAAIAAGTAPSKALIAGAVYNSTEISPTTGQTFALQADSKGRLRMVLMDAAGNTRGVNINASNQLSVTVDAIVANQSVNVTQIAGSAIALGQTTMASSLPVAVASNQAAIALWGHGATAASVPANATYAGLRGTTALPTAVSDGQQVGSMGDKYGRKVVVANGPRDLINTITQLTLTSTTAETSLIAAVASTFNDLLSIIVVNTSATATQVDFRDSTGGTVRLTLYIPAGETRGVVFQTPLSQAAVNTAWTAKCGTSVASVIITGQYIANK